MDEWNGATREKQVKRVRGFVRTNEEKMHTIDVNSFRHKSSARRTTNTHTYSSQLSGVSSFAHVHKLVSTILSVARIKSKTQVNKTQEGQCNRMKEREKKWKKEIMCALYYYCCCYCCCCYRCCVAISSFATMTRPRTKDQSKFMVQSGQENQENGWHYNWNARQHSLSAVSIWCVSFDPSLQTAMLRTFRTLLSFLLFTSSSYSFCLQFSK